MISSVRISKKYGMIEEITLYEK